MSSIPGYTPGQVNASVVPPASGNGRDVIGRSLNTVTMRAIEWLWDGWIPKGYLTIWAGESGAGKSTILADVAARVSTGAPWPGEPPEVRRLPGRVLWLGSEDGAEELTVPRLTACGANLANVTEIQCVVQHGKRNTFSMQDDIEAIRDGLKIAKDGGNPFSMLIIDPITSYLPGQTLRKVDINDAGQLRTILEPWLALARENNLAVVCVTHFTKDTTRAMLHRVLGSAAFAQTCRSLCAIVARKSEDEEVDMYAKCLVQVKINLPKHPGGAWKFRTVKKEVGIDPINRIAIEATCPEWEELDSALTPETLVGGTRGPVARYPAAFGIWLRAHFMGVAPDKCLSVASVKLAAITDGVVSAGWWDKNSGDYLEKQNIGGTWCCRPKLPPV